MNPLSTQQTDRIFCIHQPTARRRRERAAFTNRGENRGACGLRTVAVESTLCGGLPVRRQIDGTSIILGKPLVKIHRTVRTWYEAFLWLLSRLHQAQQALGHGRQLVESHRQRHTSRATPIIALEPDCQAGALHGVPCRSSFESGHCGIIRHRVCAETQQFLQ